MLNVRSFLIPSSFGRMVFVRFGARLHWTYGDEKLVEEIIVMPAVESMVLRMKMKDNNPGKTIYYKSLAYRLGAGNQYTAREFVDKFLAHVGGVITPTPASLIDDAPVLFSAFFHGDQLELAKKHLQEVVS